MRNVSLVALWAKCHCQGAKAGQEGKQEFCFLVINLLKFPPFIFEHFHVSGSRMATEPCGSFQHSPKQTTTAARTVWPCPLERVLSKKNNLAWKCNFFSPAPLCFPSNAVGSNLVKALSKARKHSTAAGSIRMPLCSSFKQLPAVMREMNLQRHLCQRSSDSWHAQAWWSQWDRKRMRGWEARTSAGPEAHTWGSGSRWAGVQLHPLLRSVSGERVTLGNVPQTYSGIMDAS